jgi:hypothetical protein
MSILESLRTLGARIIGKAPAEAAASTKSQLRDGASLGPWSGIAQWFVPRQVNPSLYEAMREAIPAIDGSINRLVTMDGIIAVEGENDAIVQEVDEWMRNVRVNDLQVGFQSFKDGIGNETYEQGFALGEYVADAAGKDIVQLRVADSKGVQFRREGSALQCFYQPPTERTARGDGTDRVEQILRRSLGGMTVGDVIGLGYRPVNLASCVYQSIHNEADNPYGTSIMRGMEFVARILLAIENATEQTWNRLGDPPLQVTYKTKNRTIKQADLDKRQAAIAENVAKVMQGKRGGNSAEFVMAVGADDEIEIKVIGAQDKIIEIEAPARHVLEQIVAKTGLPSWMLGYHWSTAERLAESQGIIVLQESNTRWARSAPGYEHVVAAMLRLRGRTWKPGDWRMVQRLPNLADELKRAQAEFLRAQTAMMLAGVLDPNGDERADGDTEAAKQLRATIRRLSTKITGMTEDGRLALLKDPAGVQKLIDEAMGW